MINREASDKTKGFRLQKLRAIELMLDAVSKYSKPLIYASIEHFEDVYIKDREEGVEYLEEDKNYANSTSFTFNSPEVLNTLVSFIDIWFKWQNSDNLALGFYSTNSIGKEYRSATIKLNNLTLPSESIIELLIKKDYKHINLLNCIKFLIIAEYKNQYNDPKHPGRIDLVEKMNDDDWINFLECIDWKFGESDEKQKKEEILKKIADCKHFNSSLIDKEGIVLSVLMDTFDERQHFTDLAEKFVHSSDIELAFNKSSSAQILLEHDPVWELWESIPISDSRNLKDKIEAVCGNFTSKKIQHYALIVSRSLLEQEKLTDDKSVLSIKYRIFEHCQRVLIDYLMSVEKDKKLNEQEIEGLIEKLNTEARNCIQSLSREYKYTYINEKMINGLIVELFDSCYLAFD